MSVVNLKGFLYVVVVEARYLPVIGMGEAAIDSLATVFLNDMEEGSTPPVFDTVAPRFDKKFKIKVVGEYTTFNVQLLDGGDSENHLGVADIELAKVIDGEAHEMWIKLKERVGAKTKYPIDNSELHVIVQYSAYKPRA